MLKSVTKLFIIENKTEKVLYEKAYPDYIPNDFSFILINNIVYMVKSTLFTPDTYQVICFVEERPKVKC